MTDTATEPHASVPPEATPRPPAQLGELGAAVHARVRALQATRAASSATGATLARLRRAASKPPGGDPALWELTVGGLPGHPTSDAATPEEVAAHTALTLYALHQQSRAEPAHVRGIGIGQAVQRLAAANGQAGVRRRFDAVATAASYGEVSHHLRGLIGQLRSAGIPLDYGMLADDLLQIQRGGQAATVRLRWARQLYRLDQTATTATGESKEGQE